MFEEESRQYLTINTRRGLYQFTRLPFGVTSAPALFQKTMDLVLTGISGVVCYIDNIIITEVNDAEHLQNLNKVLHHLSHHRLTPKKEKCSFLQPSVEFLDHRVDAAGLHPIAEKLEAGEQAPTPRSF